MHPEALMSLKILEILNQNIKNIPARKLYFQAKPDPIR
jgi:hypothetical protein